jgi:hypothetical protein
MNAYYVPLQQGHISCKSIPGYPDPDDRFRKKRAK